MRVYAIYKTEDPIPLPIVLTKTEEVMEYIEIIAKDKELAIADGTQDLAYNRENLEYKFESMKYALIFCGSGFTHLLVVINVQEI